MLLRHRRRNQARSSIADLDPVLDLTPDPILDPTPDLTQGPIPVRTPAPALGKKRHPPQKRPFGRVLPRSCPRLAFCLPFGRHLATSW